MFFRPPVLSPKSVCIIVNRMRGFICETIIFAYTESYTSEFNFCDGIVTLHYVAYMKYERNFGFFEATLMVG
jgi:hypothetical protein